MYVSKERNTKIDMIRGFAIILVICGHIVELVMKENAFEIKLGEAIHEIIYSFHMPLFFMASGYIEETNRHSDSERGKLSLIVIKNVISLYIPYLFLNYLYWIERLVACKMFGVNLERPIRLSAKEIIEWCYIGDGISWFLLSLLLIKLLFEILDRYIPEFVTLAIFSILFWLGFINLGIITEYFGWGMFYFIGYLIGKYEVDKFGGGRRCLISVFCINIVTIGFVVFTDLGLSFIVKFLIGIPVFMLLMLWLPETFRSNVISFCGRYSMVVYMMHGFSNYVCYMLLSKFINISYILLLLTIALQILIAYIVFWLYSNISWLHWIKFIFYPYKFVKRKS